MIYLLRHGEISGAGTKRYIGRTDVRLSRTGMDQARFWKSFLKGIVFDNVVSSPLIRARETAGIVSGLDQDHIRLEENFREIDLGKWDGQSVSLIRDRYPDAWEARGRDLAHYRPPGGESFSDLADRVLPVFKSLAATRTGNILVVAHAGVNRVILSGLLGKDLDDLLSIPQGYGALNILRTPVLSILRLNLLPGYVPEQPALMLYEIGS
ncbi:MAG: histidine phosphatase family protein [Pseudomonadota bacterium]